MEHDKKKQFVIFGPVCRLMPIDADHYRCPMEDLRCYKMELGFIMMSLGCSPIPAIGDNRAHHRDSGTVALRGGGTVALTENITLSCAYAHSRLYFP